MTFQEKLDKSIIISTSERTREKEGLLTKESTITYIFYFILLVLFSAIHSYLLQDIWQFSYTVVFILINLITLKSLISMSKNIFETQNIKTYKRIRCIHKFSRVAVFIVILIGYSNFYIDYFTLNPINEFFVSYGFKEFSEIPKELFVLLLETVVKYNVTMFWGMFSTIVIGVLLLASFLTDYILSFLRYLLFPFLIIGWLFSNTKKFYEYIYLNKEYLKVNVRRIEVSPYSFLVFIKKLCILILGVLLILIVAILVFVSYEFAYGGITSIAELVIKYIQIV